MPVIFIRQYKTRETTHELSALCVVSLGPVVASPRLSEDEVVWAEDLAEGAGAHRVHGAGLQIHKDGTGHVFAAWNRDNQRLREVKSCKMR